MDRVLWEGRPQTPIDAALDQLPVRVRNALIRHRIRTVRQLRAIDREALGAFRGIGEGCLTIITEFLERTAGDEAAPEVDGVGVASIALDDALEFAWEECERGRLSAEIPVPGWWVWERESAEDRETATLRELLNVRRSDYPELVVRRLATMEPTATAELAALMSTLRPRHQQVLRARRHPLFATGSRALAAELGVSRGRIGQIEQQARGRIITSSGGWMPRLRSAVRFAMEVVGRDGVEAALADLEDRGLLASESFDDFLVWWHLMADAWVPEPRIPADARATAARGYGPGDIVDLEVMFSGRRRRAHGKRQR